MVKAYMIMMVCVALLMACSNQIGVDGEVFVESEGKATKLALVEIQVIPEDIFKVHIKQQLPKVEAEAKRLQESINRFEDSIADIRNATGGVMAHKMGATSNSLLGQAVGAVSRTEEFIAKMKNEIEGLRTGANSKFYYPSNLQGEIQKVTSDADGKFKLNVPKSKQSVLAATKDDKYWIILLDPSNIKERIVLTNKNLNGTFCGECLFTRTTTPESL